MMKLRTAGTVAWALASIAMLLLAARYLIGPIPGLTGNRLGAVCLILLVAAIWCDRLDSRPRRK